MTALDRVWHAAFSLQRRSGHRLLCPQAGPRPSTRPPGRDWLNGPLVWAIDETTQPLYFFPRDCPRILLWPTPATTAQDRDRWFGTSAARMIAHVEWAWFDRLSRESLYRYELSAETFEDLDDAGMWVSRQAVTPSPSKL
uniref:Uncharacterized protein n=1 Tax=Phenylobacterium glaciei TaxID=2803784 RepID=A0A974P519_9CAUL|nr:hypothetical protein JKL49_02975 [Phenylobacterium glaciei]